MQNQIAHIENKNYIQNKDEIIGEVEYFHEFYSVNLKNERDIIIWFPPSYNSSFKKYPVLYMNDGQNLFDPFTSFAGYDWKVDEVATKLIQENLIEEIIVVGVSNTKDRLEEYNLFSEKGKKYSNFLIKELKPFIDEKYRTKTSASDTAIMGSSLGGLISFQMLWYYSKIFGKAACLSNSFWYDNRKIFSNIHNSFSLTIKNKLYIDCGSNEIELVGDYRKMVKLLNEINIEQKFNFNYYLDKTGHHSEIDWAKRLHIPLQFLFGI